MWLLVTGKNGISSYEVSRDLGIAQKSAWHIMHRITLPSRMVASISLAGHVEVDETFISGKARNMHTEEKKRKIQGRRGPMGKAIVAAVLERGGKEQTKVVDRRKEEGPSSIRP